MASDAMRWHRLQCDGIGCDLMASDAMRCHRMRCDVIGCDAMASDAMRWHRMRCDGICWRVGFPMCCFPPVVFPPCGVWLGLCVGRVDPVLAFIRWGHLLSPRASARQTQAGRCLAAAGAPQLHSTAPPQQTRRQARRPADNMVSTAGWSVAKYHWGRKKKFKMALASIELARCRLRRETQCCYPEPD